MGHYVDAGVQTIIEGLTRDPAVRPSALVPPTDTTTPPDDMAIDKHMLPADGIPITSKKNVVAYTSPSLLLRRKKRPPMVARISMPASEFDTENPNSPPPTEAVLSPLPAANKLHAGHTPIIPRALSPLPRDESDPPTPVHDDALRGPLFLPPQPGDGAEDTIPLTVLDAELEKLRLNQEREEEHESALPQPPDAPAPAVDFQSQSQSDAVADDPPSPALNNALVQRSSRKNPSESRRASADEVEVVDGVILKKPKMNMGAPLGQA
ncbi:hypothetical protein K458DRAFT_397657 [Lentithecium fluviatile CBS 122367]|uniref:Uncharacterized protein n=1 Tax=Lentithecium fluviatile CBS 122367 TaxID=1168545 RepID=A0A6G1ICN0_9PLEO|nr:hypothetical protein K458DRAFT_397657 [Lentithecium fluviatile CBS 122367]